MSFSPTHKASKPRWIDTATRKISMEVSKTIMCLSYIISTYPKEPKLASYILTHSCSFNNAEAVESAFIHRWRDKRQKMLQSDFATKKQIKGRTRNDCARGNESDSEKEWYVFLMWSRILWGVCACAFTPVGIHTQIPLESSCELPNMRDRS